MTTVLSKLVAELKLWQQIKYSKKFYLLLIVPCLLLLISCFPTPVSPSTPVLFEPTPAVEPTPFGADGQVPIIPINYPGEDIFVANACNSCHSLGNNMIIGPGLANIYEKAATRNESQTADEYIYSSIRDPNGFIVEDYSTPSLMPVFNQSTISDEEVDQIIEYLKTLN